MTAGSLKAALGDDSEEHPRRAESHGFRMFVIPRVLLPLDRADLGRRMLEPVRAIFPLAACPLQLGSFVVKEGRAITEGASWQCPECLEEWKLSRLL